MKKLTIGQIIEYNTWFVSVFRVMVCLTYLYELIYLYELHVYLLCELQSMPFATHLQPRYVHQVLPAMVRIRSQTLSF
jgi:hypothetical protein